MRVSTRLVPGLLAFLAAGCVGSGASRDVVTCEGELLACPDVLPCLASDFDRDATGSPDAAPGPLAEPHPTGHRGLVGVLNRSKALVSEDGSILPQGLHPSPEDDLRTGFWLRPEGTPATWELAGPAIADPVVEITTTRGGLRYRALVFGATTEPPAEALRIGIDNPSDEARTGTIALGLPDAPGPFQFDGSALAEDGEVRFLIRPEASVQCVHAGAGMVSCSTNVPPGSSRAFDVLLLHPGANGAVPAVLSCTLDLQERVRTAWDEILSRAATVTAPDPWLGNTFRRSLAHILLMRDQVEDFFVVKPGIRSYNSFWYRDAGYIVRALDSVGLHGYAEESLRLFWNRPLPAEIEAMGTWNSRVAQHDDGRWECPKNEHDGTGQSLWALVGHYQLGRDGSWLRKVYPAIRNGAMWLVTARQQTIGGEHAGTPHEGLLPIGYGETLIDWDYVLNHNFWGVLGLRMAEAAAGALGEAEDVRIFREGREALATSIEKGVQAAFLDGYIQAAPGVTKSRDHGSIATLYPCEVLETDDPRVDATFEYMWSSRKLDLYKFPDMNKVWTYITADWAQALLLRGEWERAYTLFEGFRRQASPILGWWEEIHLDSDVGTGDDPHAWAAANFVLWLRSMLMWETGGGEIELLRGVPPSWLAVGTPIRAAGFPLRKGLLRSLVAGLDDAGRVRVEWDIEVAEGGEPTVVLFARGRTIRSADCDTTAAVEGDHVRLAAARGACTLTVETSAD